MPMKRYKPEQIVTMLRQIEVSIANAPLQACKGSRDHAAGVEANIRLLFRLFIWILLLRSLPAGVECHSSPPRMFENCETDLQF
jgi:hypothetical protein